MTGMANVFSAALPKLQEMGEQLRLKKLQDDRKLRGVSKRARARLPRSNSAMQMSCAT